MPSLDFFTKEVFKNKFIPDEIKTEQDANGLTDFLSSIKQIRQFPEIFNLL
jgi:hypothetical protein